MVDGGVDRGGDGRGAERGDGVQSVGRSGDRCGESKDGGSGAAGGAVSPAFVALFVAASVGLFLLAAWRLNPLTWKLAWVALVVLLGYSYTKRFTALSHVVLGLALSGAPLGAWIAVKGSVSAAPFVLAGAVLLWVAGFDVLYALQDMDFDRRRGLHSIPVRLGEVPSLWLSAALHVAMLGLLALLPRIYAPGLGVAYWVGFAGCLGAARLPALGRPAGRSLAPRRGVLLRQRAAGELALRPDGGRHPAAGLRRFRAVDPRRLGEAAHAPIRLFVIR